MTEAGDVDDSHVGAGEICGLKHRGQQEFGEESVA